MHCPSIFCIGPQPSRPCEWNTQQLTWSPLTVFMYSLCVFVPFVNEMFCRPVDDTRPVWESSLPLFFSSPSSSLAYISSINPVLGGLLWSLCVLWAMVIISLLRSHCFMCLVCSLPLVPRSLVLSLLFTPYLSCSHRLSLLISVMLHPRPLSLLHFPLLLDSTYFFTLLVSLLTTPTFSLLLHAISLLLWLLHRCKYNNLIYEAALGKSIMEKYTHQSVCFINWGYSR